MIASFGGLRWTRRKTIRRFAPTRFGPHLSTIASYASRYSSAAAATKRQPVDDMVMTDSFDLHFRFKFEVPVSQRFVRLSFTVLLRSFRYGTGATR